MPKVVGWRIEDRGSFVAAFTFGTRKTAMSEKKAIEAWTKENLEPRFGPLKISLRAKTLIAVKPDVNPQNLETTDNGSPYFKSDLKQTRSSDESETRFVTDLLTGKKARENPLPEIVITVPHAKDDGIDDGHDTDWNAELAGRLLAEEMLQQGIDPVLMIGNVNRDVWDLNREWSDEHPFHIELDEHLKSADLLLDIHSYPKEYEDWGEHDVVLFAYGPLHTEGANQDTLDLAQHIQEEVPGTKVMIEQADMVRNFIQHKGLIEGAESHLIEVVEGKDPGPVMKAVADYALGVKANIPTTMPAGAEIQMFTVKFKLMKNGVETKLSLPEMLELDMEELGFKKWKGDLLVQDRLWFRLPAGMPQEPFIVFQRNSGVAYLYKAQMLSSAELSAVSKLIAEAVAEQPLVNPTAVDQRKEKLKEAGLNDEQIDEVVPLFGDKSNGVEIVRLLKEAGADLSGKEINELHGMKDTDDKPAETKSSITEKSTDEEIKAELEEKGIEIPVSNAGNFKRDRALFLTAGIVTNQSDNKTIEEALEKRGITKPTKSDGKLDRNKALQILTKGKETATVSSVEFGPKKKNEKVKLSTRVTKMVVSDLFPGTHRIEDEQQKGKGKGKGKGGGGGGGRKQIDLNKVRNLRQFQQLSPDEKKRLLPGRKQGAPLWQEIAQKFGSQDIYKNPPVKAVPSSGVFTMDVTGEFVKGASVRTTANGAAAQLNVGELEVPPTGELSREMGRLVRINMFRKKAGFKIIGQAKQPEYIVSVEVGSNHFYAKNGVSIDGYARLAHFPEKRSEPRLRVETRGELEFGERIATLSVRGKEHPLYDEITIRQAQVNPPRVKAVGYDKIMDTTRTIPKGTPLLHKGTGQKMLFESVEEDDEGTWYILKDEDGNLSNIWEDEIDMYSLYPQSSLWKMNPPGEYKMNPSAYAQQYIKDHKLMKPHEEKKFTKFKLEGPIGSAEFFEQIAKKVQVFGEGQGWVRDGYLYWKKGPGHLNYVEVDGHMLEGGTAWMHTHPAAWEPSQSSPDDFKVMHGLFINHGVRDFFTIIADRIDWFRVKKKDRIPLEEMVEVIKEFEDDIEREFHIAEEAFQVKMGDKPYLTSEQTRYITEHFNKKIPEFQMSYRAYALSPQQMNGRSVPNPPPRVPVHGFFR